jgi:16S rRNA processing protein RimM
VPPTQQQRVLLAHIVGAHGIRGDVALKSYSDDPESLTSYKRLTDATGARPFVITEVRVTSKGVVAHIKGVDTRTVAEALRGVGLHVARAELPPVETGAFYHVDLVGLKAVAPDGAPVGVVVSVDNFGSGDLLEIKLTGKSETEYVPFTDTFVPEVDVARGRVVVVMPTLVGDPEPKDEAGDDEE